jgi:PhnB protein
MNLYAHLTFAGNCREAMRFYQKCMGGVLTFQTLSDSSHGNAMPTKMKHCIILATLTNNTMVLMGSDLVNDVGLIKGNAVTLTVQCDTHTEAKKVYRRLSVGGKVIQPLMRKRDALLLGSISDKFGFDWLVVCDR